MATERFAIGKAERAEIARAHDEEEEEKGNRFDDIRGVEDAMERSGLRQLR